MGEASTSIRSRAWGTGLRVEGRPLFPYTEFRTYRYSCTLSEPARGFSVQLYYRLVWPRRWGKPGQAKEDYYG